ncbi:acid-sensing ion channel 1-like [Brachionus plicatilis]|uniref:Acid-sensing ion channel 1-like n=1 Tax=Brachionus plicatilis TaxID=10195 RepID=A0A3M7QUC7_BRAPC|nr:acid-sensing ion channel 1-like [Brachionus plicatilis]
MVDLKKLGEKLSQWSDNSTIHAISHISHSDSKLIRLIWLTFFLSAFGYFSYLIVQSTITYLKYGITTQVSYERVVSLEFPTVTFCNQKMFRYYDSVDTVAINSLLVLKNAILSAINSNTTSLKLINDFFFNIAYAFSTLELSQQRKSMFSYSIDEMLINCRFNGIMCTKNDFEYAYIPTFGNCYKFNSGKNLSGESAVKRRLSQPGRSKGLVLELFVGYDDPFWDTYRTTGAMIFVHNSSTKHLSKENGFGLAAGFAYDIAIGQVFTNKLPKPYGTCIKDVFSENSFDSFLYKQTVVALAKYEQKICLLLCLQQYITGICGCFDPTGPQSVSFPPCNQSKCIEQAYVDFVNSNSLDCFDQCPVECDSTSYDLRITQSSFPGFFYSQILMQFDKMFPWLNRNFSSLENLKKSTLALNIYYNDIGYTVINEIPSKTFEQFVGEIGGLMGLCLGASFLSFVELIELLVQLLFLIFKSNNKKVLAEKPSN